jgi:hypothetical protein
MRDRILGAVLLVASIALSYTAVTRWRAAAPPAPTVPVSRSSGDVAPAPAGNGSVPISSDLPPRPNDIVVPEPKGGINVCSNLIADDVSDELLARTRFRSRAELIAFLKRDGVGYNSMRRELIPDLVQATSAIGSCYQAAPDDHAVAYLGVHIRATRERAAVVDVSLLRVDGPVQAQRTVERCLQVFKTGWLPIYVEAPAGETFAPYDDLYLKEVPLALGPDSLEHMVAQRKAALQAAKKLNGR